MKQLRVAYHRMCGFAGGELDLREIPPGLVALTGRNYNGKTTLLEVFLAATYREWASRGTNDITKWADARDSWVEADFEAHGNVYRSRINIDGVSGNAQPVLSQQRADGTWKQITDGKRLKMYDAAIAELLPRKDALLCSQFAAQNRAGSLTGASKSQRKDLFIHFLWMDRWIAMADTAKTCLGIAETTASVLRRKRDDLAAARTPETEAALREQLAEATAQLAALHDLVGDLQVTIDAQDTERRGLAEQVAANLAAQARVTTAAGTIEAIAREIAGQPDALARLDAEAAADMAAIEKRRDKAVKALDERIARGRAMLEQAEEIRAAVSETDALKIEIDGARETEAEESEHLRTCQDLLRDAIAAALMDKVPCHGADGFAQCQFLTNAREAKERIGSSDEATLRLSIAEITGVLEGLKKQRETATARLKALAALDKQLPVLQHAEQRLTEDQDERQVTIEAATAQVQAVAARLAAKRADFDARKAQLRDEGYEAQQELTEAQEAVQATQEARQQVDALEAALATSRATMLDLERQRIQASVDATSASQQIEILAEKQAQLAILDPKLAIVDHEIRLQSVLARGFHRDGLPTLEIAAAAPAVSQTTNDLLEHSGFGTRFRVDVTTLVPSASGGWKEDFAIRIWDNVRSKEIPDIDDLSGSERILVEEALRAALTLIVGARHAEKIRTCWRDETTGPLDEEHRAMYVSMLRRLRELGGYEHVLFISHATDVNEAADTIVDVKLGAPTIRRVA